MSVTETRPQEFLKKFFGFDKFKGNQEAIVESLLEGNDTFVIMPTGGGKSLCYQLPAVMEEGVAIVISPLIALMKNQVDALRGFSTTHGVAHVLNSSLTKRETAQVKEDLVNGHTKLLYVAPESLNKEDNIEFLKQIPISFFAIDEAHCISEWGHDFRPEYRNIRSAINKIGRKPVIALTATATPKVQSDIIKTLGMDQARIFRASFNRPNLYYDIRPKIDIDREIIKILQPEKGKSAIIYCLSRAKVEELAQTLQVNGINALPYHAGLDSNTRVRHQDAFLMEDCDVIVATIAFGMGIDKPDVRYVIHYDMPKSLESYYQETGRAGRDGAEGNCIAFYSVKDIEKLEKFLAKKPVAEQEIGKQLLQEALGYAETSMCRRKYLLHYFGEDYNEDECNNMCDNHRFPKKKFDAKEDFLLVLQTILESTQRFKSQQVINTLMGHLTSILKTHNAQNMSTWMQGKNKSQAYWDNVIRQGVVFGLIDKEIETYGLLKLTDKGKEFMDHPVTIMIPENHNYNTAPIPSSGSAKQGGTLDDTLFKMLKDLTKKIAKSKGVPPYAVFQEVSLQEMSINYPTTLDELKNISGVGEGKAKKFGKDVVAMISKYVEENDIERPMDFVVKSVANKSVLKVYIITSTDKKLPLDDIASAKGLTIDELIKEMEIIVFSGTRLNIDYYLEDILDEDSIEEIYDWYLDEAEEGTLEEAVKEFGEDYSEEELRLVKLKFMSEVAN